MDSNGKLYIQRNEENKQSAPSPSDPSTRLKRVDVMSDQPLNDMLIIARTKQLLLDAVAATMGVR